MEQLNSSRNGLSRELEILIEIRDHLRALNQTSKRGFDALLQLTRFEALGPERICTFVYRDKIVRFHIPFPQRDLVQSAILRTGGFFEISLLEEVIRHITPGSVIVDAGANIGNHTVFFAIFCQATEVIAVEPMNRTFEVLEKNVRLNHLHNVRLINRALGETPGTEATTRADYDQRLSANKLLNGPGEYPVTTIDRLGLSRLDLLKVSVEGSPASVLNGAVQTLARCRPMVWVSLRSARGEREVLDEAMSAQGYRMVGPIGSSPNDNLFIPD